MSQQEQENGQEPEAQPLYPQSGPGKDEMAAAYLPDSDEWESKTNLNISDPAALAALSQLGTIYPEVEDLQSMVDDSVETFLKSKISVQGKSRREFEEIIKSMFGNSGDDDSSGITQFVAADQDD